MKTVDLAHLSLVALLALLLSGFLKMLAYGSSFLKYVKALHVTHSTEV